MAASIYLADTSVYVLGDRSTVVRNRLSELLSTGRLSVCHMTALEYLNNAATPGSYEKIWQAMHSQRWLDVTAAVMDRAMEVHRELARRSQHRHFRLPDLLIAATAELNAATVLHYDADYDRIADVTGQSVEWVVPRGSL